MVVDFSRCCRSRLESAFAQFPRCLEFSFPDQLPRLHKQADPFLRIAKNQRAAFAGKNLGAQGLAMQDRLVDLRHQHAVRIHVAEDLELRERLVPRSDYTKKLEEENAQLGVGGRFLHRLPQAGQCLLDLAAAQMIFRVHRMCDE